MYSSFQEWYLVHRVDLHNCLKQRASETATLHTGCTIVRIDIDNSLVVLDDGREFTADVLLGADGAHVLWSLPLFISPTSPTYTKQIIKRRLMELVNALVRFSRACLAKYSSSTSNWKVLRSVVVSDGQTENFGFEKGPWGFHRMGRPRSQSSCVSMCK
jgi:hypothetical protein